VSISVNSWSLPRPAPSPRQIPMLHLNHQTPLHPRQRRQQMIQNLLRRHSKPPPPRRHLQPPQPIPVIPLRKPFVPIKITYLSLVSFISTCLPPLGTLGPLGDLARFRPFPADISGSLSIAPPPPNSSLQQRKFFLNLSPISPTLNREPRPPLPRPKRHLQRPHFPPAFQVPMNAPRIFSQRPPQRRPQSPLRNRPIDAASNLTTIPPPNQPNHYLSRTTHNPDLYRPPQPTEKPTTNSHECSRIRNPIRCSSSPWRSWPHGVVTISALN
jgi:hypothetical protein